MVDAAQGGVEANESLQETVTRELKEEIGSDMDVWSYSHVPASAYSYAFPEAHAAKVGAPGATVRPSSRSRQEESERLIQKHVRKQVFFMPVRAIRGSIKLNKEEGLVDYAWLTKEEIKDVVGEDYWEAVEPALSDR
jgi:large subunit ribosomal protein L46